MDIVSSKPVTLEEAKETLETREKDGEFGYEQQQALEYLNKFAKKKEKETVKELIKNKKITLEAAVKIAGLAPKSPQTLKAILLRDKIDLNEEEIAEILKLVS